MECEWCLCDTVEKLGEWRRIGRKLRSYYHCHTCNVKWNTQSGISTRRRGILKTGEWRRPVGGFTFASHYFPWDTETWEFDINEEER